MQSMIGNLSVAPFSPLTKWFEYSETDNGNGLEKMLFYSLVILLIISLADQ